MIYIGPLSFRETVTKRYDKVKDLLSRQDQVIVVGDPQVKIADSRVEVSGDEAANAEIDDLVRKAYRHATGECVLIPAQYDNVVKLMDMHLKRDTCKVMGGERVGGVYQPTADCIALPLEDTINLFFLDSAPSTLTPQLRKGYARENSTLPHELIHADMVLTTPLALQRQMTLDCHNHGYGAAAETKLRDLVRPARHVLKSVLGSDYTTKERFDCLGIPTFESMMEQIGLVESVLPKVSGKDKEIIERELEVLRLGDMIGRLNIDTINEAVAYPVGWKFQEPDERLLGTSRPYFTVFDHFDVLVAENPKAAIEKAKEVIEEAWQKCKSVLDILGLPEVWAECA